MTHYYCMKKVWMMEVSVTSTSLSSTFAGYLSGSGVRVSGVQRREEPTRDVYVTRDERGDREFAGEYGGTSWVGV